MEYIARLELFGERSVSFVSEIDHTGGIKLFSSYGELVGYVKEQEVEMLDIKVTDIQGRWRHLSIPASRLSEKLFDKGFGFDGSNYGYAPIESSDMVFVPDFRTAFIDPFWERNTLSFLGSVKEITSEGFKPYGGDPRMILKKAIQVMKDMDIADEFIVGPEFEYNIFDGVQFRDELSGSGYKIISRPSGWNVEDEALEGGHQLPPCRAYHIEAPHDIYRDLRSEAALLIDQLGIDVKYHHHEVGTNGQQEIEVQLDEAMKLADASMLIKYIVKNSAAKYGLTATFMPKTTFGEAGNGLHVHMLMRKDGKSIFAGPDSNYAALSDTALHFLGGILTHTPALMGLVCPSTNSYRRLVRGYEAPIAIAFATGNRSGAIRIPGYAKDPEARRFEFRSGDATANIYLMFASLLMAGLDGVRNRIDPMKGGFGPLEKNIYEQTGGIKLLPASLDEALDELEKGHSFLTSDDVFSEHFLTHWIRVKRREAVEVKARVTAKEYELYYNC